MKPFKEYQKLVGPEPEIPPKFYMYYAYKSGKVFECQTTDEAKKIAKFWEAVVANQEEIELAESTRAEWCRECVRVWKEDLKENFFACYTNLVDDNTTSSTKEALFQRVFSVAWAEGHSQGYDRVSEVFEEQADFAESIVKIMKGKYQ